MSGSPACTSQVVPVRYLLLTISWLLLGNVASADLSIELVPGLEQNRNFERWGHWTRQWVRSLPPENEPYLLVVQGPDSWLATEGTSASLREVAQSNRETLRVLLNALDEHDLLRDQQALGLAARIVALIRPVIVAGRRPQSRNSRIWLLWEVLADASHADTLSAAVAAVQALDSQGVDARLAAFLADGVRWFGVVVPGAASSARTPWSFPVGADALIPVYSPADLDARAPDTLSTWSWSEMVERDWTPGELDAEGGRGSRRGEALLVPRSGSEDQPDLCKQAEALGFDCVPRDARQARQATLAAISILTVLLLTASLALVYRRSRQRRQRAEERREHKKAHRF